MQRQNVAPSRWKSLQITTWRGENIPRMFLGLANFYRQFIKGFSKITAPMMKLLKKENMQNFQWMPDAQEAFDHLRIAFTTASIL